MPQARGAPAHVRGLTTCYQQLTSEFGWDLWVKSCSFALLGEAGAGPLRLALGARPRGAGQAPSGGPARGLAAPAAAPGAHCCLVALGVAPGSQRRGTGNSPLPSLLGDVEGGDGPALLPGERLGAPGLLRPLPLRRGGGRRGWAASASEPWRARAPESADGQSTSPRGWRQALGRGGPLPRPAGGRPQFLPGSSLRPGPR